VIEASRFRHQRELVTALREAGAKIVLDTEAAELAAPAKFSGHSRRAPWALSDDNGSLGPAHFHNSAHEDVVGRIARFAVENRASAVLAPSHFLGDPACQDWLSIDAVSCIALREALDREGGNAIAIDYPLIMPNTMLNDAAARGRIISALADLPFDNVWVRVSGFGADAGPLTMKRYLSSMSGLHNLGKPLVADYLGGIAGMAALAFGAVSGLAQGIGERERFDAGTWHKPPPPRVDDAEFGRAVRVTIPGLQRSVLLKELQLLVSAKGGRRLCGCGDRACCAHGYTDTIADPRRHAAHQLFKAISLLEAVPDLRRESHFINGPMATAERLARQVKSLRPSSAEAEKVGIDAAGLMKRFEQHSRRIEQLSRALDRVHEDRGEEGPRCRTIGPRGLSNMKTRKDQP
jgi:hypothetical protein